MMNDAAIPEKEFHKRVENIKSHMGRDKIDLMILAGDEHYQGHVRYVSNYRPMLEFSMALIDRTADPILLCGPECKTLAYQTSKIKDIRVCSDLAIPGEEYPNEQMFSLKEILAELETAKEIEKVGIVNLNMIPNFIMSSINEVCRGKHIINATHIVDVLRGIKSENEIRILKRAYEMGQEGIKSGLRVLGLGITENEILAEMAYPMYKMGAEQMSHCFYAASGKGSSPALYFSEGSKRVSDGDIVILDIGAVYNGYFSDIATARIVGKKSNEKTKVLDTVRKALEAAGKKVRPGILGKEIDRAAREITTNAGYGKNHLYGVVHGVGLQHCEYPFFGPTTEVRVEEGMFFNIDIGLFDFEFGGVRMENGYLVTSDGCEVFAVDHE